MRIINLKVTYPSEVETHLPLVSWELDGINDMLLRSVQVYLYENDKVVFMHEYRMTERCSSWLDYRLDPSICYHLKVVVRDLEGNRAVTGLFLKQSEID